LPHLENIPSEIGASMETIHNVFWFGNEQEPEESEDLILETTHDVYPKWQEVMAQEVQEY
jgi:hypothetical protein